MLAGACVGSLPIAILYFPYGASGIPPWYLEVAGSAAMLGALGGSAFYMVHRAISEETL